MLVGFPDFPTVRTDRADASEEMAEAIDCLGSSIKFATADKASRPNPSRMKRGQKLVPGPLWIVAKLALSRLDLNNDNGPEDSGRARSTWKAGGDGL